jgi:hypothetical protein
VGPVASRNYVPNHRRSYTELSCQLSTLTPCTSVSSQNLGNYLVGQLRASIRYPLVVTISPSDESISGIVLLGSGSKVGWIATGRMVTGVQNKWLAGRQRAECVNECQPMGQYGMPTLPADSAIDHPVPGMIPVAVEFPAGIRPAAAINASPEVGELFWGNISAHVRLRSDVPRRRVFLAPLRLSVGSIIPATVRV